jgi:hypothetical protein
MVIRQKDSSMLRKGKKKGTSAARVNKKKKEFTYNTTKRHQLQTTPAISCREGETGSG